MPRVKATLLAAGISAIAACGGVATIRSDGATTTPTSACPNPSSVDRPSALPLVYEAAGNRAVFRLHIEKTYQVAKRCESLNVFSGVVLGYYWNGIGVRQEDTTSPSAPIDPRFPLGSTVNLFDSVRSPDETATVRYPGQGPELEYAVADAVMKPGADYVVAAFFFDQPGPYQWLISSGNESVRPWHNGVIEATSGTTKVPAADDDFQAALLRKREESERSRTTVAPQDSFGPQPGVDDQGCVKPIDEKGQLESDAPCLEIDPSTHRPKGEPPPQPDPNAPIASTSTSQ